MNELNASGQSSFEEELKGINDDIFCPDALDWNCLANKYLDEYYSSGQIPTLGDIIEDMLSFNMESVVEIAELVMKYKMHDFIMCKKEDYRSCAQCNDYEECLDSVLEGICYYEYSDELSPIKLAWGLYEILYKGDKCIYIPSEDVACYPDLLMFYDYDNEEVLSNVYRNRDSSSKQTVIINHAQISMFDDLYTEGIGNCFNYGNNFILVHDSFNEKYSGGYYIG